MTNYINPIDQPNPFLTTQPIVFVVRHVRQTVGGELVVENANDLPRHLRRIDAQQVFPKSKVAAPMERNIPECGRKKKEFMPFFESNPATIESGNFPVVVAAYGDYIYVWHDAASDNMMEIYNVSDPNAPTLVGGLAATDSLTGGAGFFLMPPLASKFYAASRVSNFVDIISVSDPSGPVIIGEVETGDTPVSIAVSVDGNTLFVVSNGNDEIESYDITDPENPELLDSYATDPSPVLCILEGNYLYVFSNDEPNVLAVINVTDPANMALSATLEVTGVPAFGGNVHGDYLYVANEGADLAIYNISNPADPTLAKSIPIGATLINSTVADDHLYTLTTDGLVRRYELTDPTNPGLLHHFRPIPNGTGYTGLAVYGRYAYVTEHTDTDPFIATLRIASAD